MLVHFPIALFMTGVGFDFAARWTKRATKQATLATASRLNILAAAVSVLPTLATGIAAWQWQMGGHKLKGMLLLHVALGGLWSSDLPGRGDAFWTAQCQVLRFRVTTCRWRS